MVITAAFSTMSPKLTQNLFFRLTSGDFSPQDGFDSRRHRIKFALRGILQLPHTLRWLNFLTEHPELLTFLQQRPRMAIKPHRPYLMQSMGAAERVHVLMSHYRLLKQLFRPALYHQLLEGRHILLAELEGKNEQRYRVVLNKFHNFDREGELSLHVDDQEGNVLAIVTFVLYEHRHQPALLVAGLQGAESGCPHEHIKTATKNCHGLFPKKLAMETLLAMARMLNIPAIHAISKEAHIYNTRRYRKYWKGFEADYNSFWKELGGTELNRDLFLLPHAIYHKPLEEIESKKRAEHRRRHALLEDMQSRLHSTLQHSTLQH